MNPAGIDLVTKIVLGTVTEDDFIDFSISYNFLAGSLDLRNYGSILAEFGYSTKENVIRKELVFSIYTPDKKLFIEICQNEDNSYEVDFYP